MEDASIERLTRRLLDFRDQRNWRQFHTGKNLATSITIEAAELLEIFQWQSDTFVPQDNDVDRIKDEAADVFLYLLLLCQSLGINLIDVATAKLKRNEARFPVESSYGIASQNKP